MDYKTILLTFQSPGTADEVLAILEELEKADIIEIEDAAVIRVDAKGEASVKDTEDVDAGQGAAAGAIFGGLLGVIAGPVGLAIGLTAGAVVGATTAAVADFGFSKEEIASLRRQLGPNTSGIMAIIEQEWLYRLENALGEFSYDIFVTTLEMTSAAKMKEKQARLTHQVESLYSSAEKSWQELVEQAETNATALRTKIEQTTNQMTTASAEDKAKVQAELRQLFSQFDTQLKEVEQKIKAQLQTWDSELAQKRAEALVVSPTGEAKTKMQTEIARLNIKRAEAIKKLKTSLETRLHALEARIDADEKALESVTHSLSEGFRIELEQEKAEREATRQELEHLKTATKAAAKDLQGGVKTAGEDFKTGLAEVNTDLNEARDKALAEYK
jgi:uncharacterized membrane protein